MTLKNWPWCADPEWPRCVDPDWPRCVDPDCPVDLCSSENKFTVFVLPAIINLDLIKI